MNDLNFKPLPPQTAELEIEAHIEPEAFELIKKGFAPTDSSAKWALVMDDALELRIYRTATGSCIFAVQFSPLEDGFTISHAAVNRDPAQYRGQDPVYDARLLIYLIRRLLLGHPVPFPMPAALPQQNKAVHEQHVMGSPAGHTPSVIPLDFDN